MAILGPFLTQLLGDIWKQQSIKVVPIVVSILKPSHIQTMPPTSIWSGDNVRSKFESFLFFIFLVLTNGVAISSLTFIAPVHEPPESESLLLWITMGALRSSLWSIRTLHSYLLYVAAIPNIYSVSSGNNFFGTLFALSSSHAHITPACPRCPTIPGPRSRMVLVFDKRRVKSGFNPCGYNSILRRTMDEREMREKTKWSFALELLLQWVCWVFTFRFPGILHQTYLDKD